MSVCLPAYGAFHAFGGPNALENLVHVQTTYFKHNLFNSSNAEFGAQTVLLDPNALNATTVHVGNRIYP